MSFSSVAAEVAVSASTGLGCLGLAGLALGLVGLLNQAAVLLLAAAIHLCALPFWREVLSRWRGASGDGVSRDRRRRRALTAILGLLLLSPALILPLYPPTAFDATMYHLPYAKFFAEEGRVAFAPHLRYPVFPQLVDLLFTLMYIAANDISAAFVQTLAMLLVALLLYAWGTEVFSRRCGLWAGAIWLGNPLVVWNARAAFVDVALALFIVLAAYAFHRWKNTDQIPWLALSAAACGFAAGTKYHGLLFVALFGIALVFEVVRRRQVLLVAYGLVILVLVAMPWYGRNYYHTGNPIFPLFSSVFGQSEWSFFLTTQSSSEDVPWKPEEEEPSDRLLTAAFEVPDILSRRVSRLIFEEPESLWLTPWRLSFNASLYQRSPVSPIYLLTFPIVLFLALRKPLLRILLGVGAFYGIVWLSSAPDPRYLIPILGLLALPAAAACDEFLKRLALRLRLLNHRWVAIFGLLVLIAPALAYASYKLTLLGPLPVTAMQREIHLSYNPRYGAIRYLNLTYGSDYTVYALNCENLVYHAHGRLIGDHFGPARFVKVRQRLQKPTELHTELRRLGADHFLVPKCERDFSPEKADDSLFELTYHQHEICVYRLLGSQNKGLADPERSLQGGNS